VTRRLRKFTTLLKRIRWRINRAQADRDGIAQELAEQGFDLPVTTGLIPIYGHRYVVSTRHSRQQRNDQMRISGIGPPGANARDDGAVVVDRGFWPKPADHPTRSHMSGNKMHDAP